MVQFLFHLPFISSGPSFLGPLLKKKRNYSIKWNSTVNLLFLPASFHVAMICATET